MTSNLTIPVHPTGPPTEIPNAVIKDFFHPLLQNRDSDGSILVAQSTETRAKFSQAKSMVSEARTAMEGTPAKPGDDVVVVPLGTGSAIPGQYRTGTSRCSYAVPRLMPN